MSVIFAVLSVSRGYAHRETGRCLSLSVRRSGVRLRSPEHQPAGNLDMLIAAIAKQSDYILVTNNTDHFRRVHGLKVENWVK